MTDTITVDEWLADLNRLADQADDDGAMTILELARAKHCCEDTMRVLVRKALACGAWECVWVRRTQMNGVSKRMSAYRPIQH